jgi:putative glutamine amidotransferase
LAARSSSELSAPLSNQRPKIGITVSPKREAAYYDTFKRAVENAGGEAVTLQSGSDSLPDVDGLLLPGGWDVDPALYGEEAEKSVGPIDRQLDDTELELFRQAREKELPVLGICRGQQVINVAMGGSLIQHLEDHDVRVHGRKHLAHTIEVDPESELGRAAGETSIRVNSLHHQAVRSLAPGLHQTAKGQDGTVEGLESDDGLIVAVQCHPEELTGDLPWAKSLFERFVARARTRVRKSKG